MMKIGERKDPQTSKDVCKHRLNELHRGSDLGRPAPDNHDCISSVEHGCFFDAGQLR